MSYSLALPGKATAIGLELPASLSFDDWEKCGTAIQGCEQAVMWWLGDWWLHGEHKYGESAAQSAPTGYGVEILQRAAWVASRIEILRRRKNLTFWHHYEVAGCESEEIDALLSKAESEEWTIREIRQAARQVKAARTARQQAALPSSKYRVIYADPPWRYSNEQPAYHTEQADHYPLMSIEELCSMPIAELAEDDAVLFMWATSPILEECFSVIQAWGFEYKTSFVWDKVKHNMGHYNSVRHEFLLVATRGACTPDVPKLFDSVVTQERGAHSEKPGIFYDIIETLYPHGKKIEMFSRKKREGWDGYGNELADQAA